MRQEDLWDDTAACYDTPGAGMFAPEVLGPTVDRLPVVVGDMATTRANATVWHHVRFDDSKVARLIRSPQELTADWRSHVSVYRLAPT